MKNLFCFVTLSFVIFSPTLNAQWVPTSGTGSGAPIRCFAENGTGLLTGSWGGPNGYSGGVFLSTDNGANWRAVNTGLTDTAVFALAVSGSNVFAGTGSGVFLSTNNGTNWMATNAGLTNTVVNAFALIGTNLFAGTSGGGVFLSTSNGTTWGNVGLENKFIVTFSILGSNLFAGTPGDGVFLSTDNGANWTEVNTGLTNTVVNTSAISGSDLFVGTNSGVFRSTDNGVNWINTGGMAGAIVNTLAAIGTNLFAGTSGGGVFLSTNNGTNWTSVGIGIPNTMVNTIAISGSYIFAGTQSSVIYRRVLSDMVTSVGTSFIEPPVDFTLTQNYPNPFNPSTTISFSLPSKSFVSLKVFDLIGREVATLFSGQMSAGSHSKLWNASTLPSGIYFYRLQAGSFTETKKLILLK